MIGLDGLIHEYPRFLFLALHGADRYFRREYDTPLLARDRITGLWRILPVVVEMFRPLWELPHFNPARKMRCIEIGQAGKPKRTGRKGLLDMLECGIDTSRRMIEDSKEQLEHTRKSQVRMRQIVADARKKRRAKRR